MVRISGLTKNNMNRLFTDMHALIESTQADNDSLFLLYSLAYMTGTLGILKENLRKTQVESPVSMGIRNFLPPYLMDEWFRLFHHEQKRRDRTRRFWLHGKNQTGLTFSCWGLLSRGCR